MGEVGLGEGGVVGGRHEGEGEESDGVGHQGEGSGRVGWRQGGGGVVEHHGYLGVILHVGADTGEVDEDGDVGLLEESGRADTGALQDLGRVECSGGEDHFLAGFDGGDFGLGVGDGVAGLHVDTGGLPLLVEGDGVDAPPGEKVEVLALGYRGVVAGARVGAGAGAVVDGALC